MIYTNVIDYYNSSQSKTYFFDGFAGADSDYALSVRFFGEESMAGTLCT